MFTLEHVDGARDIARDIDIVLVFEETTQPVTGVLLVVYDKDGWLQGVHAPWPFNCPPIKPLLNGNPSGRLVPPKQTFYPRASERLSPASSMRTRRSR